MPCKCGCKKTTRIAPRTITSKGHIKGMPQPFVKGHHAPRHGHCTRATRKSEYNAYLNARQRCSNPKHTHFAWYGARGILFKFKTYEEFFSELGPKPTPEHTVDRKNNNGHYEVGNVRWSTRAAQLKNRRPYKKRKK